MQSEPETHSTSRAASNCLSQSPTCQERRGSLSLVFPSPPTSLEEMEEARERKPELFRPSRLSCLVPLCLT